ncbi:hypothetical protein LSH36_190g03014 [Paralvinella palmiformis]|uniref:Uncharacterized protein n=1 Tax=Paralvinella palmiformis TaxID=53620 RepID=A0AAD9N5H0_9ANNE|nr:hypothetical protein LSH36_190g03014 [Paralvinella palmiformis]
MAEKKYTGAPFGTQTARFDVSGVHPKNKVPGTFTETPYCRQATSAVSTLLGPGKYEVEYGGFSNKAVMERASGPGWARAYEVSRIAAMPHLLHKEQWEFKRLLKRKLGPGSYDIKDFLQASDEKPRSTRGIIQTKDTRFKENKVLRSKHSLGLCTFQNEIPGPGTYGKGGVPHAGIEEKARKSASTVGLLDAGAGSRSLPSVGSHLGPGNYNFASFTEQMSKKVTSLRGPYDLYSGDRNKPIRTGHYAAPSNSNLGPGQYELKSFVDDLETEHKKRTGRFGKVEQYPGMPSERIYAYSLSQNPRRPTEPGPGVYDSKDPNVKPPSQAKKSPGFLSSAMRSDKMATKFFTGNFNPVGPGRYDIQKWDESQHRNGHNSVFKSKTTKLDAKRAKFLQERVREKDVPVSERVFIVEPDIPSQYVSQAHSHYPQRDLQTHFASQRALTVA